MFTGQLATKFTAHVCVLCLCLQGSWPQSLQLMFVSCACVYRAVGHKGYSPCYYNYVQVCFLSCAYVYTAVGHKVCSPYVIINWLKYVCVLCLYLHGGWPQSVQPICCYNYVQVCLFPVPVFTGWLATKCMAPSIGSSCLTSFTGLESSEFLQGSWPQSVQPIITLL